MGDFTDNLDHRQFDQHRYAVVDSVWREDLPAHWPLSVIAPHFLGEDTERCPVLLDVQALLPEERGELMEHAAQQVKDRQDALCSLLLASDREPQAVADHLAQRMVVQLPHTPQPQQFRFFDPGTFLQLPRLLGADGMVWLLGPARAALVPWAGGWSSLEYPPTGPSSFALKGAHLAALTRMGAVNRLALQMEPPAHAPEWTARCATIDAHVERAMNAHGLRQQDDLLAFARHAMTHHPAFDRHPRLAAVFDALRQATPEDELDYRELTSPFTPQEWQTIATELRQTASNNSPQGRPQEGSRT